MRHFLSIFLLLSICSVSSANQKEFIIGLDADLSAVAAEGGLAIQAGAQIAIDEINEQGGVLGHTFKLVAKDHKGNPARGIKNLSKLAKIPNLVAVLGGVHSPVIINELETIHENEIVYLVPWAASTIIVKNKFKPNYVFRASIRDEQAGQVLIAEAKSRRAKRIALLLEKTGWGYSNETSMRKAAKEHGIEIVAIEWLHWGASEVDKQLSALAETKPDALMLVANAPEGIVVGKAWAEHSVLKNTPIISHWGISSGSFAQGLGLDILNQLDISIIQTFSFANAYDPDLATKVLSLYREKYDEEATQNNIKGVVGLAQAYDLTMMLAKAIEMAQSSDRNAIRNALEKLDKHRGLVKNYEPPFTETRHDALLADDYFMARYNEVGELVPK
jgi:branched-chain amino acid transport system substrate-binding protein